MMHEIPQCHSGLIDGTFFVIFCNFWYYFLLWFSDPDKISKIIVTIISQLILSIDGHL